MHPIKVCGVVCGLLHHVGSCVRRPDVAVNAAGDALEVYNE